MKIFRSVFNEITDQVLYKKYIYIYDTNQRVSTSDAKNWIKTITVHGHYSCPLSYRLDRFNHYMRHTKNITSYHCFKQGTCG